MRFVGKQPPRTPPFGVARFEPEGEAWLVEFAAAGDARSLVAQLPPAGSLPRGTLVVVMPEPGGARGLFARLGPRRPAERAARAGALLLAGYTDLGAATDARSRLDLVWGRA